MAKKIIKELIILLLISLAILLILGIVLYDYMPNNKVIPEIEKYEKSAEIQEALTEAKAEEQTKVVLTYEITDADLNMYRKTNEYNVRGKNNPFAEYVEPVTETEENSDNNGTENNNNSGTNNNNNNGGTNSDSQGRFIEKGKPTK